MGQRGTIAVRVVDRDGKVLASGETQVDFWNTPRAQIHPNNFLHQGRNHNWQRVAPGETVGQAAGSVPLAFLLFEKPTGTAEEIRYSRDGIAGVGVLSYAQLRDMKFDIPANMSRYNSGLILRDSNGDGKFDVQSLAQGNAPLLSQPTGVYSERAGERIGGAIMQVQFTTGAAKGKYRPTFALLLDPDEPTRDDGTSAPIRLSRSSAGPYSQDPPIKTNATLAGFPDLLLQAWFVPRWISTSPGPSTVSSVSMIAVISPSITIA